MPAGTGSCCIPQPETHYSAKRHFNSMFKMKRIPFLCFLFGGILRANGQNTPKSTNEQPTGGKIANRFEDVHAALDWTFEVVISPPTSREWVKLLIGPRLKFVILKAMEGAPREIGTTTDILKKIDRGFPIETAGQSFMWVEDSIFLSDSVNRPASRYYKDNLGVLMPLFRLLNYKNQRNSSTRLDAFTRQLRRFEILVSPKGALLRNEMDAGENRIVGP